MEKIKIGFCIIAFIGISMGMLLTYGWLGVLASTGTLVLMFVAVLLLNYWIVR